MLEPTLKIDPASVAELFRWFPKITTDEFKDALAHAKAHFFLHFFRDAGSRLSITRRKGLINQINGQVLSKGGLDGMMLRLRSINYVAQAHEFGASITPRKSRYLLIPLPGAMRSASGYQTLARPRVWSGYRNIGSRSALTDKIRRGEVGWMPSRNPKYPGGFLVEKTDRRLRGRGINQEVKAGTLLFGLGRRVEIKPRLGFYSFWRSLAGWQGARLERDLKQAARRAEIQAQQVRTSSEAA